MGILPTPTPTPTVTPTPSPTPVTSRAISFVGGTAPAAGGQVTARVVIAAQGDENGVGFSLNYDPALLSNPVVTLGSAFPGAALFANTNTAGKIGVVFAEPTNVTIPAGDQELVTVTFDTFPTAAPNTTVTFGDVPVIREVSNVNADELPAQYVDGTITFAQGFEADVVTRPTGNGAVTVADVTQVGRFSAGLDAFDGAYNEFQRADSAPRSTFGNGAVTVADYTQAGRYAAGLDPLTGAGGPSGANLLAQAFVKSGAVVNESSLLTATSVQAVNTQADAGSQAIVQITANAQGIENGFGFTLDYDPTELQSPVVALGADAQTATLFPNTTTPGKVGVVLAFPANTAISPGVKEIITITFAVAPNAPSGQTALTFSDSPVVREISDVQANVVGSTWTNGVVNVAGATAASVTVSGRVLKPSGKGINRAVVTISDMMGNVRKATTNQLGYYRFDRVQVGKLYVLEAKAKNYRFDPIFLKVLDVTDNVNFTALP